MPSSFTAEQVELLNEVRAKYDHLNRVSPGSAFNLMRAGTWPNGMPKTPVKRVENLPPEQLSPFLEAMYGIDPTEPPATIAAG